MGFDLTRGVGYIRIDEGEKGFGLPTLDITNPNYNIPDPVINRSPLSFGSNQSYSAYLQDQIDILENLKLLVGGRFDWASQNGGSEELNESAFSPRIGLVYQLSKEVSLYTSYSQSFVPDFGANPDGKQFKPTRGTQYEAGIKADFLDGKLSASLAGYQITKSNVLNPDPDRESFAWLSDSGRRATQSRDRVGYWG
ncbi:TonB-dependent receptor [Nostoc sp. LPT]|uniref:TonB-dependent siderophore receptor n=1 Tax=Nostoc sp. LPT TaxID=2815387 RepID=UPI0025DC4206|nr:TonB-dependent receptor [Nostoc sp. LPT]